MNVIEAVRKYITKMTEEIGPGMKVLLMDKETTSIVSIVFSQSELLQKEVYLFERLDLATERDSLKHLKCIVFIRPTLQNISLLSKELRNPRYGIYYIYFSNIIAKSDIKTLAESDEQEVVREVAEYFADYVAVSPHLFSFNISVCSQGEGWDPVQLQRAVQGIGSLLLSLKKCPIIRHTATSGMAKRLAEKVHELITLKDDSLFGRVSNYSPTLLILDRKEDPITPLLTQWTYQAMVHELFTITNNRVNLKHVPDIPKELEEVILSPMHDDFYAQNLFCNYGEIGQKMRDLMMEYQEKMRKNQKMDSIADMKQFVESYPQFKKTSGALAKHVTIVGELSNMVQSRKLLEVSELEQHISCQNQHSIQLPRIRRLLSREDIRDEEKCKVVMIYGLRYSAHQNNDVNGLLNMLAQNNVSPHWIDLVSRVIRYGNKQSHLNDSVAFGTQEVMEVTKRFFKDLKGVENIFTQHTPVLKQTLEDLIKGKLRESAYPFFDKDISQNVKVADVIVFVVGGVTYEEALSVHQLNCAYPTVRIIIGGTNIHNSASFLKEVEGAVTPIQRYRASHFK